MPLWFSYHPRPARPGTLLHSYWPNRPFYRPEIPVYLIGPSGGRGRDYVLLDARVDPGADWTVLDPVQAFALGQPPPFSRRTGISGAGGTSGADITLPPDGTFALLITDNNEYCYLPGQPVAFWDIPRAQAGASPTRLRSVLGLNGFLHFFQLALYPDRQPPMLRLDPIPGFPGAHGRYSPSQGPLADLIRDLRRRA